MFFSTITSKHVSYLQVLPNIPLPSKLAKNLHMGFTICPHISLQHQHDTHFQSVMHMDTHASNQFANFRKQVIGVNFTQNYFLFTNKQYKLYFQQYLQHIKFIILTYSSSIGDYIYTFLSLLLYFIISQILDYF